MNRILLCICLFFTCLGIAQTNNNIILLKPDLERGSSVMQSLFSRASAVEFDSVDISLRDLSDLLWAANGINRPENGKRTAPSAINAQDIDIYVFLKTGVYLYNPKSHILDMILNEDHRKSVAGSQQKFAVAPVFCVLVSDISRFNRGEESGKQIWAALDAGIVSQNISLFCASVGLLTRPRAYMDKEKLRQVLNLKENQLIMLNHPVSNVIP